MKLQRELWRVRWRVWGAGCICAIALTFTGCGNPSNATPITAAPVAAVTALPKPLPTVAPTARPAGLGATQPPGAASYCSSANGFCVSFPPSYAAQEKTDGVTLSSQTHTAFITVTSNGVPLDVERGFIVTAIDQVCPSAMTVLTDTVTMASTEWVMQKSNCPQVGAVYSVYYTLKNGRGYRFISVASAAEFDAAERDLLSMIDSIQFQE